LTTDAERWDARWAAASGEPGRAHPMVEALAAELPAGARVLDVAAGRGRQARALAAAGVQVVAVDVSGVGLARVGRGVETVVADLKAGLPEGLGAFDAVVCVDYHAPLLWPDLRRVLAPGGHLVVSMATVTNLERHTKPSRRFLATAEDGDRVLGDLCARTCGAEWRDNGRHELWVWGVRA